MNILLHVKILLIFFNICLIYAGGFNGNTLIATPDGYVCISSLKIGDSVLSYNFESSQICTRKVLHVESHTDTEYRKLVFTNSERLELALDQKLLITPYGWLDASQLVRRLQFGSSKKSQILRSQYIRELIELYEISVEEDQNFFVTENNILAHNMVIVALPLLVEALIIMDIAITAGMAIGVYFLGNWLNSDSSSSVNHLKIKPPNNNDWIHILHNKNHGFNNNNDDPDLLWSLAKSILVKAIADNRITDGNLYKVSEETGEGILEITGKVINGMVHIGTMYFKGKS